LQEILPIIPSRQNANTFIRAGIALAPENDCEFETIFTAPSVGERNAKYLFSGEPLSYLWHSSAV
jgi:hypothetical protein